MKRKLLTASAVTSYIFTVIYALVTAAFYSVSEKIYVLFLVLMVASICLGLYNESLKKELIKNENKLSKRDNIILIVLTVLSVINFPACIFNLLALTYNKEDKYLHSRFLCVDILPRKQLFRSFSASFEALYRLEL